MTEAHLPDYEDDQRALRRMFSFFPSGIVALIAEPDDQPVGLVAASFTVGVSLDPPLVSCAIQHNSSSWPEIKSAPRLGVSVFGEDQNSLMEKIGRRPASERFDGISLKRTANSSARFIPGAPIWLECSVHDELMAGDHLIALLKIERAGADADVRPLIYYGSAAHRLHVGDTKLEPAHS